MLSKPRRWLAYTIEVNDLLECYDQLLDRFERADVPLDGVFGSNTQEGSAVPGLVVAIGPAVEPARLAEVLPLLEGFGRVFLLVDEGVSHNKFIAIGSLNLNKEPVVALSQGLAALISTPGATADQLCRAVEAAPRIHVLGREE